MITAIRCENFRCFKDTGTLKLAPITILVGENNSGKSAIIQSLHLPALALGSEDPSIRLKLLHQDYDYGSFKDIVFRHNEKEFITMSYEMLISKPRNADRRRTLEPVIMRLTYGYLSKRKEIYLHNFVIEDSDGERLKISPRRYTDAIGVLMRNHEEKSPFLSRLIGRKGFTFQLKYEQISLITRIYDKYPEEIANKLFLNLGNIFALVNLFNQSFNKIYHLGPLRIPPSRTYMYSGELVERLGMKGEFALQKYSALRKRNRKEDREKTKLIDESLYKLGFINEFTPQKIGTRHYEFWTKHNKSLLKANLADTGFGTSQVLPVIVSLFTSPDGSTLLFEQPEIHLHPAAQAELGSIFARACSPKKRILIETHSENMILRIRTEVAKGTLKPDDVLFYYTLPKKLGHKVLSISLNEDGEFSRTWPKGFFEENYIESLELSRARHSKKQ